MYYVYCDGTVFRLCLKCIRLLGYSQDVLYKSRPELVPAIGLQQPCPDMQRQHPEDQPKLWVHMVSSTLSLSWNTWTHEWIPQRAACSLRWFPFLGSWSNKKSPLPTGDETGNLRAAGQAVSTGLWLSVSSRFIITWSSGWSRKPFE